MNTRRSRIYISVGLSEEDSMANLKDRKPADKFHGLLYGDSGAGKTHLVGQFPTPLILDTDFGLETLVGKDIDYEEWYVRAGEDGWKTRWKELLDLVDSYIEKPTHETLVVDSLTTLVDVVSAHVISKAGRGAAAGLQLQDYSAIYTELTKLIVKLRRVPTNMILTAHEDTFRDALTMKLTVRPLVIGVAFAPKLPIFFNNIYCAVVEIPKGTSKVPSRELLVQSDGTRLAKSQAKNNDLRIEKSYESILEHISREV